MDDIKTKVAHHCLKINIMQNECDDPKWQMMQNE